MSRAALTAMIVLMLSAGCSRVGESRLNPFNWFGRTTEEKVRVAQAENNAEDPRPLIAQILTLTVERTPGGAIVRATGLPPRLGYYEAALVPANRERPVDGVLEYRFRVNPPLGATPVGSDAARQIDVARFVSDQTLAGVRSIRVVGAANALVTRR